MPGHVVGDSLLKIQHGIGEVLMYPKSVSNAAMWCCSASSIWVVVTFLCYPLATGPEPGISLQDEDQLSPAVQRQPLLFPEPTLGPLLEAPCPPHHLTATMNRQTKPSLVISWRTDHCHLYSSLFPLDLCRLIFQFAESCFTVCWDYTSLDLNWLMYVGFM